MSKVIQVNITVTEQTAKKIDKLLVKTGKTKAGICKLAFLQAIKEAKL